MSQTPREIMEQNAGAVWSSRARSTGTVVTVYRADEAGMEDDPETPWATVCEDHGSIVCHKTRRLAESWLAAPEGFCDDCRDALAAKARG